MRKLVLAVVLLLLATIGCQRKTNTKPAQYTYSSEPSYLFPDKDEIDRRLDSLTAAGEYMLIRGSDREYETIVGNIRYKYVKSEGYDTPRADTSFSLIKRLEKE